MNLHFPLLLAVALVACAPSATVRSAPASPPAIELVETAPVETLLDHPDIPEAHHVWLEMMGGARASLDFAEFYASTREGSRLEPALQALQAAAGRGVRVRFLVDERLTGAYPETVERIASLPGVELRRVDGARVFGGGVLHAKYFVVDGREAYLGSQNFDWRSLEHIQELGLRIREPRVVSVLANVFEGDWAAAGGPGAVPPPSSLRGSYPVEVSLGGERLSLTPVLSPRGRLPDEGLWDLPRIVALIDGARRTVRVQLLTYRAGDREGGRWEELDAALRRAAGRGVAVEMLLADWSKREGSIQDVQSLAAVPGIAVRLVTIPASSAGFIPYARVIHAKYLVVDGARTWIGTSNWERSYFYSSRNVGLIVEGAAIGARMDRFFLDGWRSPYAETVDPRASYRPPRISE